MYLHVVNQLISLSDDFICSEILNTINQQFYRIEIVIYVIKQILFNKVKVRKLFYLRIMFIMRLIAQHEDNKTVFVLYT